MGKYFPTALYTRKVAQRKPTQITVSRTRAEESKMSLRMVLVAMSRL
jgi:hypothetical protein